MAVIGNAPFQGLVSGGSIIDASIEGVDLSTSAIAARLGYTPVDPGAAAIIGGTINGTTIGATTAASGAFTNLSASGTLGVTGVATLASGAVLNTPASVTLTNATGLPVATGVSGLGTGVAAFLATPSSANLAAALTDKTGSGANVFATSPTLVTPVLGTPTSGNFSTGTFTWPTFNQNTTGTAAGLSATLATASGGTGLTAFTANGVVYASSTSALTTGSALTFNGSLLTTGGSTSGSTIEVLRLSNSGAGANTQAQLKFYTTSTNYGTISGGYGSGSPQMTFDLPNATPGLYVWQISGSTALTLTSSSLYTGNGINVGIGNSNPQSKLHIQSTVGTAETLITLQAGWNSPSGNKSIAWSDGSGRLGAIGVNYTAPQGAMTFGSLYNSGYNTTDLMTLTPTGLGIGVTPYTNLTVGSTSDVGIAMTNSNSVTSGNRGTLSISNSAGSTVGYVRFLAVTDNSGTNLQFGTRPAAGSVTNSMLLGSGTSIYNQAILTVTANATAGRQNLSAIDRTTTNWVRFTNPQYSAVSSMGLILKSFPDSDDRQGAGIVASGGISNNETDLSLFITNSASTSYAAYTATSAGSGVNHTWNKAAGSNAMTLNSNGLLALGTTQVNTGLSVWSANAVTGYTIGNMTGTMNVLDYTTPSAVGVGGRIVFGATYYINGNTIGTGYIGTYKEAAPSNGSNEYNHALTFGVVSSDYTSGREVGRFTSAGDLTVGDTAAFGRISAVRSGKGSFAAVDTSAYAAGVGGTIDLGGNYRSANDYSTFVRIAAEKTNATNANYSYNMGFYVTSYPNSTFGVKVMTLESSGSVLIGSITNEGHTLKVGDAGGGNSVIGITAGAASTSSLWFGDTDANVGYIIYNHATNSMAFRANGGTESMRISSAGNLGINNNNPSVKLTIGKTTSAYEDIYGITAYGNTSDFMAAIGFDQTDDTLIIRNDQLYSGGGIGFRAGGTTNHMFIKTGGNVGIGTTAPGARLEVLGNGDPAVNTIGLKVGLEYHLPSTSTLQYGIYVDQKGGRYAPQKGIFVNVNNPNGIYGGEYWGIDTYVVSTAQAYQSATGVRGKAENTSSNYGTRAYGVVGEGISAPGGGSLVENGQGAWGGYFTAYGKGNSVGVYADAYLTASPISGAVARPLICGTNGSFIMYVMTNGGIANYSSNNTNLSDIREKKNIQNAGSYLEKICAIPVKTFQFVNEGDDADRTLGVVAQDVQAIAPEFITEDAWPTEAEPDRKRLSLYQTDMQFALMKCIQEQQAMIVELQQEVAILKGGNA